MWSGNFGHVVGPHIGVGCAIMVQRLSERLRLLYPPPEELRPTTAYVGGDLLHLGFGSEDGEEGSDWSRDEGTGEAEDETRFETSFDLGVTVGSGRVSGTKHIKEGQGGGAPYVLQRALTWPRWERWLRESPDIAHEDVILLRCDQDLVRSKQLGWRVVTHKAASMANNVTNRWGLELLVGAALLTAFVRNNAISVLYVLGVGAYLLTKSKMTTIRKSLAYLLITMALLTFQVCKQRKNNKQKG